MEDVDKGARPGSAPQLMERHQTVDRYHQSHMGMGRSEMDKKKPEGGDLVDKAGWNIKEEPATGGSSGQRSDSRIREKGEAGYEPRSRSGDMSGRAGSMRKAEPIDKSDEVALKKAVSEATTLIKGLNVMLSKAS